MCALLSDLIHSWHRLASYHDLGVGLYESRPFSRLLKFSLPFFFQLKNTPPLHRPAQCSYGWFKERFLFIQQVRKIKSNIKIDGKVEEKKNTGKNQFLQINITKKIRISSRITPENIRKFEKGKVHSPFIDNIGGAALNAIPLINKSNHRIRFSNVLLI